MFWKKLGLKGACNLSYLLNTTQPNINYEKYLLAKEGERGWGIGNSRYDHAPERDDDYRREDKDLVPPIQVQRLRSFEHFEGESLEIVCKH